MFKRNSPKLIWLLPLLAVHAACGAQDAGVEASVDDEARDIVTMDELSPSDPCWVWVNHADSIATSMKLYKENGVDYREDLEKYFRIEQYEDGSAGNILLNTALDAAGQGLPKEEVKAETLAKCQTIDPEYTDLQSADMRIPADAMRSLK